MTSFWTDINSDLHAPHQVLNDQSISDFVNSPEKVINASAPYQQDTDFENFVLNKNCFLKISFHFENFVFENFVFENFVFEHFVFENFVFENLILKILLLFILPLWQKTFSVWRKVYISVINWFELIFQFHRWSSWVFP